MDVSRWLVRGAICLAACGRDAPTESGTSRIEAAIDRGLTDRLGVAVVTTCTGMVPPCVAQLPDGTRLPIDLAFRDGGWDWHVRGLVVTTDQLEAYVRDELADLGAPQDVRCVPRVRAIAPGEQIACELARGGKAFVTVRGDGTTSLEVALDANAATARSELVTPARDRELEQLSRALAHAEGDEEGDDSPQPGDAGTDGDPR